MYNLKTLHLPFGSAGGFDDGRHPVPEQVLALAEIDDVENHPLRTQHVHFEAAQSIQRQLANLPKVGAQIRGSIAAIRVVRAAKSAQNTRGIKCGDYNF